MDNSLVILGLSELEHLRDLARPTSCLIDV